MATTTPTPFTSGHRKLVYDTTRWQRILTESRSRRGVLADGIADTARALHLEMHGASDGYQNLADEHVDMVDLATEIFARAYDGPERLEAPNADVPIASVVHDIIGDMPEWKSLCAQVQNDPDFAAMAAGEVLKTVAKKMPDIFEAAKQREEEQGEDGEEGDGGMPGGSGGGQGNAPGLPGPEDMARAALRRAIRGAQEKVDDGKEALSGIAPGLESAPPIHEQENPARMALAERLLQDDRLRSVLKKAGRISRLASSAKRSRTTHARSEVVDVERGNDIARMLPSALARLRHPVLRKLALRDIVEANAPQYRLEGKETLGRGPIVVAIDRSSSMTWGESEDLPQDWASAAAIALASQATKERRPITTLEFNYGVTRCLHIDERGKATTRDWSRRNGFTGESDYGRLKDVAMTLATSGSSGGTSFDPVTRAALDAGLRDDRADFIFITDGEADVSAETLEELRAAKEKGLRVFALTLNGGSSTEAIKDIADIAIDLDKEDDIAAAIARAQAAASKID